MAKHNPNTSGLRPLYSFDQFVIGPYNHVAAAACHEVINKPGETYNPLFVYGPSGVGKTHLVQATAHEILHKNPQFLVRYISAERFVSEILMAISEDKVLDLRKEYSDLDLLIIDDVQYLSESKMSQDELFHIFNNLHESNSQVILAADRPPNQLTALNKNVRSRLEWGLAADVGIPDEATRLEILKKKQEIQGLKLNEEMLVYVAQMLRSNVRELEGFLKRIHAYVTLSHQEVSLELVQAVLEEILPEGVVGAAEPPPRSVDRPVKSPSRSAASSSTETARGKSSGKEAQPVASGSGPPAAPETEDNSFNSLLDSISNSPMEEGGRAAPSKSNSPPATKEPIGDEKTDEEDSKNGLKKPGSPRGDESDKQNADLSLPPPSLPPSAPSHHSFDVLIESMNSNAPEAPTKKGPPPAAKTPPPAAPQVQDIPEPTPDYGSESDELPTGHKEVGVVFFYPEGCKEALQTVQRKFQEVIKKHKLKFRMKLIHDEPYSFKGKINYSSFVDVCKANKVPVAVVIGPPPDTFIPEQDFYDLLTVTLDVQGVSLQLVNWGEISKDYRYLNLALDIALVRAR